jgi:hypothetical protein
MYSSILPSTSTLDGGGLATPRPGRLTPGKTLCPLYMRLRGPEDRSGRVRKVSPSQGLDPGPSSPQRIAIPTALYRPRKSPGIH